MLKNGTPDSWYAIAHYRDGICTQVFITKDWDTYCKEFELLTSADIPFKIWCGKFDVVDDFRKRCFKLIPYDNS